MATIYLLEYPSLAEDMGGTDLLCRSQEIIDLASLQSRGETRRLFALPGMVVGRESSLRLVDASTLSR